MKITYYKRPNRLENVTPKNPQLTLKEPPFRHVEPSNSEIERDQVRSFGPLTKLVHLLPFNNRQRRNSFNGKLK